MGTDSILVVSSYPEQGETHSQKTVGGASYARMWLQAVTRVQPVLKLRVLAEMFVAQTSFVDENVLVERVWHRSSLLSVGKLIGKLIHSSEKTVIVSFEAYMFGSWLLGLVFLMSLGLLKLFGKQVVLVLHQVPDPVDAKKVSTGILSLVSPLIRGWYFLVKAVSNTIIVFESALASRLGGGENIVVIPHLIPAVQPVTQIVARKKLGWQQHERYSVCFGYIAPYKGVLELVQAWPQQKKWHLVIAGGINPNHVGNREIEAYVEQVEAIAREKGIVITGFVPEAMIASYYCAADVIVMAHSAMLSSSGPLALAWAYGKPVAWSKALAPYLESNDIAASLAQAGITASQLIFDYSPQSILEVLNTLADQRSRHKAWSEGMQEERSEQRIAQKLIEVVQEGNV